MRMLDSKHSELCETAIREVFRGIALLYSSHIIAIRFERTSEYYIYKCLGFPTHSVITEEEFRSVIKDCKTSLVVSDSYLKSKATQKDIREGFNKIFSEGEESES